MKYLLFLYLLIASVSAAVSQNANDSLSLLLRNYQYEKALKYIEKKEPTKESFVQKALCYKALGEYKNAIDILTELASSYPSDVPIISELATCYQAIAQRQAGIDCYDRLIAIDSTNIYFKIQKAELEFQIGRYDKALTLFYKIYNQNNSANTLKQIAQCYEMMNEVDSAIIYYRKTLSENPLDGYSAASLTNICLKEGLIPEGKASSQAFMDMDTTNLQVNLLNALCYYATTQEYGEAINRFKLCEQRGDTSLILNRSLGNSYFLINNFYDAEIYLDKAYRQDTTNNTVLYALASSSLKLGDHWKSAPLFQKLANKIKPDSVLLSLTYSKLGESYGRANDYNKQIQALRMLLLYQEPIDKMAIYYSIANIYDDKLNDIKNALVYYTLYRGSLVDYVNSLKKKEEDENSKNRIEDSKKRIKALDEHILDLEKGETKDRKSFSKKQTSIMTQKILEEHSKSKIDTVKTKDNTTLYILKDDTGKMSVIKKEDN